MEPSINPARRLHDLKENKLFCDKASFSLASVGKISLGG
jgi:hypothetical protein